MNTLLNNLNISKLYFFLVIVLASSSSCNSQESLSHRSKIFTIASGDGLQEKHIIDSAANTHTIEYMATGSDSFWFNCNSLQDMNQTFSERELWGMPVYDTVYFNKLTEREKLYYEFYERVDYKHGAYRKLILSLDARDTLLDSIPLLSKRVWTSPTSRKVRITDHRPRSRNFPLLFLPEKVHSIYDISEGLIKETYRDSFYKYQLILNAKSMDTIFFTSRKDEKINEQQSVVTTRLYDANQPAGTGSIEDDYAYILPSLVHKSVYEEGELSFDSLFFVLRGKSYLWMASDFSQENERYLVPNYNAPMYKLLDTLIIHEDLRAVNW